MNKIISYIFIISLSSCSCCNRPDYCPEYELGYLFKPYQNNSNFFVNEFGKEFEMSFNYNDNSSVEPGNGCMCYLNYEVSSIFTNNYENLDYNINFNNGEKAYEDSIPTKYMNFEFANIEFSIETGSANIENSTYLGNFHYNDTLEVPHSNLIEDENGVISELVYSLDSGIVRFTLNDTVWYRNF